MVAIGLLVSCIRRLHSERGDLEAFTNRDHIAKLRRALISDDHVSLFGLVLSDGVETRRRIVSGGSLSLKGFGARSGAQAVSDSIFSRFDLNLSRSQRSCVPITFGGNDHSSDFSSHFSMLSA